MGSGRPSAGVGPWGGGPVGRKLDRALVAERNRRSRSSLDQTIDYDTITDNPSRYVVGRVQVSRSPVTTPDRPSYSASSKAQ